MEDIKDTEEIDKEDIDDTEDMEYTEDCHIHHDIARAPSRARGTIVTS